MLHTHHPWGLTRPGPCVPAPPLHPPPPRFRRPCAPGLSLAAGSAKEDWRCPGMSPSGSAGTPCPGRTHRTCLWSGRCGIPPAGGPRRCHRPGGKPRPRARPQDTANGVPRWLHVGQGTAPAGAARVRARWGGKENHSRVTNAAGGRAPGPACRPREASACVAMGTWAPEAVLVPRHRPALSSEGVAGESRGLSRRHGRAGAGQTMDSDPRSLTPPKALQDPRRSSAARIDCPGRTWHHQCTWLVEVAQPSGHRQNPSPTTVCLRSLCGVAQDSPRTRPRAAQRRLSDVVGS